MMKEQKTRNIRIICLLIVLAHLASLFFVSKEYPDSKHLYIDIVSLVFNVCLLIVVVFRRKRGFKLNPQIFLSISGVFVVLKVIDVFNSWLPTTSFANNSFDVIDYAPFLIFTTLILTLITQKK